MSRSLKARTATIAVLAGTAAATAVMTAGTASAIQANTVPLNPGQSFCVQQNAGYQVRATGTATADGARFKLLRNGQVLQATPGRVSNWAVELRTTWGNFPGPGTYAACAFNTGTSPTTVYLEIRTDSEI